MCPVEAILAEVDVFWWATNRFEMPNDIVDASRACVAAAAPHQPLQMTPYRGWVRLTLCRPTHAPATLFSKLLSSSRASPCKRYAIPDTSLISYAAREASPAVLGGARDPSKVSPADSEAPMSLRGLCRSSPCCPPSPKPIEVFHVSSLRCVPRPATGPPRARKTQA